MLLFNCRKEKIKIARENERNIFEKSETHTHSGERESGKANENINKCKSSNKKSREEEFFFLIFFVPSLVSIVDYNT